MTSSAFDGRTHLRINVPSRSRTSIRGGALGIVGEGKLALCAWQLSGGFRSARTARSISPRSSGARVAGRESHRRLGERLGELGLSPGLLTSRGAGAELRLGRSRQKAGD